MPHALQSRLQHERLAAASRVERGRSRRSRFCPGRTSSGDASSSTSAWPTGASTGDLRRPREALAVHRGDEADGPLRGAPRLEPDPRRRAAMMLTEAQVRPVDVRHRDAGEEQAAARQGNRAERMGGREARREARLPEGPRARSAGGCASQRRAQPRCRSRWPSSSRTSASELYEGYGMTESSGGTQRRSRWARSASARSARPIPGVRMEMDKSVAGATADVGEVVIYGPT